jgi:membrane fusion protein (multidrug efflux system)
MTKRNLLHALAVGAGLLAACGSAPPATTPAPPPAASVQAVSPTRGPIVRSITLPTFRILAYQEATLYAKVSGYLQAITVDKGSRVAAGELLARIEVPELLADQQQYRAEVDVARTNYERMAAARRRAPDLVVPQTVDDLRGRYETARARLARVESLLEYARITAPFAGIVTNRFVDPGAFIPAATSGTPAQSAALLTLVDSSRVRVQVFVPEPEVPFIVDGLPAAITVEELPGRTFSGSVTRSAWALDEATKTMLTEIELANPGGELRPGMYASVRLDVERKPDALLLPADAVVTEKAGTFVFVVADGKARKVPVRTGFADGTHVEILSGVEPGQAAIVAGKQTLTDGQPVTVTPAG